MILHSSLFTFYLSLGLAKPALAILIAGNGLVQVFFREIRPICITEIQFAVGNLPEQVVRNTQFAASADEQVWVGHETGGQMLADGVFGNVLGTDASGLQFLEDVLRKLFRLSPISTNNSAQPPSSWHHSQPYAPWFPTVSSAHHRATASCRR